MKKYSVDELNELKEKAKRIKELRIDNDLGAKEIYNLLNLSQGQYSRIENGINELSYDGLIKLSLYYGVSIDYLLGLTNKKDPYPRNIKKSL